MDNKLLNKTIQISAKEEKLQSGKPVVKIKDEKGLTYTIYKFKKDNSVSIAWEQMEKLSLGENVFIGYVEEINDSPEYGKVTYRTIRTISTDIAQGVANYQSQTETPHSVADFKPQTPSNDAYGRRLAIHGMVNGLLASGTKPNQIDLTELLILEDKIEVALTGTPPVSPDIADMAREMEDEPLPEEPLNVEDIPF